MKCQRNLLHFEIGERGLYKMICFIKHTSGCHTSLVAGSDMLMLSILRLVTRLHMGYKAEQRHKNTRRPGLVSAFMPAAIQDSIQQ